jgi:biotin carboxyl carrier protein
VADEPEKTAVRDPQGRLEDHATIARLADDLLPALAAKLGANGLGELEVREDAWRVRLRMPADGETAAARLPAPGRQASRSADAPRVERRRPSVPAPDPTGQAATALPDAPGGMPGSGPSRIIATSPAVGYFRPRADLQAGAKVRAGDRIGSVDVLGIGQDLVAPGDGLVGATLVAAGEPVEYGQAVIVLQQLGEPRPGAMGESGDGGDTQADVPEATGTAPAGDAPDAPDAFGPDAPAPGAA